MLKTSWQFEAEKKKKMHHCWIADFTQKSDKIKLDVCEVDIHFGIGGFHKVSRGGLR